MNRITTNVGKVLPALVFGVAFLGFWSGPSSSSS